MGYKIKIPLFEGPFDLLLFFIERDEIDIMDIPISEITRDFLEYISDLEKMNIEVASEFIVVAATLMRIKSKMLLPRLSLDEDGNEIDPRDELVEHLLEYKKYKSVIEDFSNDPYDAFANTGICTEFSMSVGELHVTDVVASVTRILTPDYPGWSDARLTAADITGDGELNVLDVVTMVSSILEV